MKIYKKLGIVIGLSSLMFVLMAIALPKIGTRSASAASPSENDINTATFDFQDRSHIIGHFGTTDIIFTDKDFATYDKNAIDGTSTLDTTGVAHFSPPDGAFCTNKQDQWLIVQRSDLNINKSANPPASINATIHLNALPTGSVNCTQVQPIRSVDVGTGAAALALVTWNTADLLTIDGTTLHAVTGKPNEFLQNASGCDNTIAITDGTDRAIVYSLTSDKQSSGRPSVEFIPVDEIGNADLSAAAGSCYVNAINFSDVNKTNTPNLKALEAQRVTIAGTQGQAAPGGDDGSGTTNSNGECVFNTNSGGLDVALSWILCPVIKGLSNSADLMDGFVESQLNFNTDQNLPAQVEKAWAVFKDLTSIIIVIALLVMIISQAIGGGPFDAYTIRKLLPKLVAAVILMQISWQLCVWMIQLSNDAGQSISQLMAVPFGGKDALDLASLLHNLDPVFAAAIGLTTEAGAAGGGIALYFFGGTILAWGWPILLLALLLVFFAIVVALLTLLVRNALIILLVILSPLAFLAWVLPGTQSYWKLWKDNFVKLLVFFPLVMALIYAGRIFAWTAGGLGTAGPFDALMVFVGFFGPYFFLPKSFKWGGGLLSSASTGIREAWPIKKGQEAMRKGLMGKQQRNIREYAKKLDPTADGYTKVTKKWGKIPVGYDGKLGQTMLQNLRAGRVLPTKRALANTIQQGEQWNSEEEAIAAARVKREKDKAVAEDPNNLDTMKADNPTYTYKLNDDGMLTAEVSTNPTARGKAALLRALGSGDERYAGAAAEQAIKTGSWVEVFKDLVPVSDPKIREKIEASGAEIFDPEKLGDEYKKTDDYQKTKGKIFVRAYDVPRWNSKINGSEDLYPATLGKALSATPHIGNPEGRTLPELQQKSNDAIDKENAKEVATAAKEGRDPAPPKPYRKDLIPHHLQRAVDAIDGYLDNGNVTGQTESQYGEWGRLSRQPGGEVISAKFGQLLERMATSGSSADLNALSQMASNVSMRATLNDKDKGLLTAPGGANRQDIDDYVQKARENSGPVRASGSEGAGDGEAARINASTNTNTSGSNTNTGTVKPTGQVNTEGSARAEGPAAFGELNVPHGGGGEIDYEAMTRAVRRGVREGHEDVTGEAPVPGSVPGDRTHGNIILGAGTRSVEGTPYPTPAPRPPTPPPAPPEGGGPEAGEGS